MSEPDPQEEARQRLADNLARRSFLFKLTLGAGVSLFLSGMYCSSATPYASELTLRAFGHTIKLPLAVMFWVTILYLFTLALRAIWLPDSKLKRAGRNLYLMGIGVGIVAIVWAITGSICPR